MPIRRCSGLSTRNSPPKDQNAWPPRLCSPSWSTSTTRRPASASSAAATRPARPAPTTTTSESMRSSLAPDLRYVVLGSPPTGEPPHDERDHHEHGGGRCP